MVLHGWGLARATGQDDTIDRDEVEPMWPEMQSIPDQMRIPGHFGPGIVVFGPAVAVPVDPPFAGPPPRPARARPGAMT